MNHKQPPRGAETAPSMIRGRIHRASRLLHRYEVCQVVGMRSTRRRNHGRLKYIHRPEHPTWAGILPTAAVYLPCSLDDSRSPWIGGDELPGTRRHRDSGGFPVKPEKPQAPGAMFAPPAPASSSTFRGNLHRHLSALVVLRLRFRLPRRRMCRVGATQAFKHTAGRVASQPPKSDKHVTYCTQGGERPTPSPRINLVHR